MFQNENIQTHIYTYTQAQDIFTRYSSENTFNPSPTYVISNLLSLSLGIIFLSHPSEMSICLQSRILNRYRPDVGISHSPTFILIKK